MKAKEELLKFVFDNEFIVKPRLKSKFELLVNNVIDEAQQLKNRNTCNKTFEEATKTDVDTEKKYKELLQKFLEAVFVYGESGFDDMLYDLEDEVKNIIGDEGK